MNLAPSDDSSADCAGILGQRAGYDRKTDVAFHGFAENIKISETTGKEDTAIQVQFSCEERGSAADGVDDTESDIAFVSTVSKEADDFGFSKYGAHTGDVCRSFAYNEIIDILQVFTENTHHDFDEAAGTCGTFVVHQEVNDVQVVARTDGSRKAAPCA